MRDLDEEGTAEVLLREDEALDIDGLVPVNEAEMDLLAALDSSRGPPRRDAADGIAI